MSKSNIRKITVEKCNIGRPSVFERLGTKPAVASNTQISSDFCRNWAVNGSCSYGKSCKYANTHTLISPSKRAKKDNATTNASLLNEDPFKRLTSKLVKKVSHSPDLNIEDWNQTDLEYEDEKVLERRRQLLQRELEIQMKKDKEVHGKDKTKFKKKVMSSSSSSRSSSSSSSSSTSSSDDSSSTSTSDSRKKVKKLKKVKHHSASPDYDDDKDRKKKLKLKRLGQKNEKLVTKKKRKVEVTAKKDEKSVKKANPVPVRKHSVPRVKSPVTVAHVSNNSKSKEKNRSESPKPKAKEAEKDKHHKKLRDEENVSKEMVKTKPQDKPKELEKSKNRVNDEKTKTDDKAKRRSKEREKRSRTPPIDRAKHTKETASSAKSKRSRTPEKPAKTKQDHATAKHQDKRSTSSRSRELDKKERDFEKKDSHKRSERSKDRDEPRKADQNKSRPSSSQDDMSHRKNVGRDFEDKNCPRQRSKERRDKDHPRNDHRDSRMNRDQRDKDRDDVQDRRDRQRDRERDKEPPKIREREIPSLMATAALNPLDKGPRYRRSKDRIKDSIALDKGSMRGDRRDRDKEPRHDPKQLVERDRSSQRYDARFDRPADKEMPMHKLVDRERIERFPRDRSLDRIAEKNLPREQHLMEREPMYERDRHRRFNPRFERGHPDHKDQHLPSLKMDRLADRRDSPRANLELERNFDRNYSRLPPEHWNEEEEQQGSHMDYRDHHPHEDERRKGVDARRYSPFGDRRARDDRGQRYGLQGERQFDEMHHPVYPGDKMRAGGGIRDESSNDNWDVHHDMEHGVRDNRNYQSNDWEEREWRGGRAMWERESLPRSDAHEEEWPSRYDSPMSDWKMNETRKWDNQPMHVRGSYRSDNRMKDMDAGESNHGKRRSYNTPEIRDEMPIHVSKQGALHNSMKDEPINKKLMELAEGRPRRSREKSSDSFQKKVSSPKEKVEVKETPAPEVKRANVEESLQTLHTESDLSDISDDPDDILNMDDEVIEKVTKKCVEPVDQDSSSNQNQEPSQAPVKQSAENAIFPKEKDTSETIPYSNKNIEDESMETMDFEEISDGELEEDIKTSGKGLGDALGVDWASLVNESQPRRSHNQDVTQNRWQCKAVFQRIGISVKTAGNELVEKFIKKYGDSENEKLFMDDVALMHTALVRKHLFDNSSYGLLSGEDLLYSKCEKKEENPEDLKPCTSLYEEAKMLLQQAA